MNKIEEIIVNRGITRLCHFTKSKNLPQIFSKQIGILASDFIEKDIFEPNDKLRLDGKTQHINCSVQFPNMYYFNKIYSQDQKFKEWVILFINPYIIKKENTYFCPVNAAKGNGRYIKSGIEAFQELFRSNVDKIYRSEKTPLNTPTNLQAEVLIYQNIPVSFIEGIVVPSEEQAKRESVRLEETLELQIPNIYIIPELFEVKLAHNIREGIIPKEIVYKRR